MHGTQTEKTVMELTPHHICVALERYIYMQNPGFLVMCVPVYILDCDLYSMLPRALQGTLAQQTDSLQDLEERINKLNQELVDVSCFY